jgi:succinoglycan biosynthesis protein ExoM
VRCSNIAQLEVHKIMGAERPSRRRNGHAQCCDAVPLSERGLQTAIQPSVSVAILICTRERSRRLEECLRSLLGLRVPAGVEPIIVVVENDERPTCQGLVLRLIATSMSRWQVRYSHEPRLGIPIARNHALAIALEMCVDWVAFIDDDETVTSDWLEAMLRASLAYDADVLQGPVDYVYPPGSPVWLDKKKPPNRTSGTRLRTAYTNNVMMKAGIASSDGLGLAFDERLRFTGGSDADYFCRAADRGAVIRWVEDAVVREVVTGERLTMAWQAKRALRVAANASSLHSRRFGSARSIGRYAPKSIGRICSGSLMMAVSMPLLLVRTAGAQRIFFKGLKQASSGIGGIGAFFNLRPQPYLQVDGDVPDATSVAGGADLDPARADAVTNQAGRSASV